MNELATCPDCGAEPKVYGGAIITIHHHECVEVS